MSRQGVCRLGEVSVRRPCRLLSFGEVHDDDCCIVVNLEQFTLTVYALARVFMCDPVVINFVNYFLRIRLKYGGSCT